MDPFSVLPPTVVVKILNYLPLKDQVRIARVNKTFERFSTTVISKTKFLNLTDSKEEQISKLSPESFSKLINLCSDNLETVYLYCGEDETEKIVKCIEIFSQISFPRLIELDVGYYVEWSCRQGVIGPRHRSAERDEIFKNIIRRIPNLKKLRVPNFAAPFPTDVVCEHLVQLELNHFDEELLESLIGFCPNLQDFAVNDIMFAANDIMFAAIDLEILDEFFARAPNIRRFRLYFDSSGRFDEFKSTDSFWRLPLIDLTLSHVNDDALSTIDDDALSTIDDDALSKIAQSFPNLENFNVSTVKIGQPGLTALKSLQHLKTLMLSDVNGYNQGRGLYFDVELRSLALECPRLETVKIDANISILTLKMIIQFCPQIQVLKICRVVGVETVEDARLVVESFPRVEDRKLTVQLVDEGSNQIWVSDVVKEALSNLGSGIGQIIRMVT